MKSTKIKVIQLTNEQMLNHSANEYNPAIGIEMVKRYIDHNAKFYEAKPDAVYSYSRFFAEYKINEGLYFFKSFSPFCSALSNNGFVRAFIIDGEIFVNPFGANGNERVVNTKEGRKWLADNICKFGTMVTTCF